jgi:hypothetical protein
VRIQSALLCEAGTIESGKLYILGASLALWWVSAFPAVVRPILAGVIEADRDLDTGQATFEVAVTSVEDGQVLRKAEITVSLAGDPHPGVPWIIPMLMPLEFPVTAPGAVDVSIASGAGIEARLPLMFMPRPSQSG